MRKGDFIMLIVACNKAHCWPATGIIIGERSLPTLNSAHSYDMFPEHDPFALDILWNDGVVTRGVDGSWLERYYFVP